MKQYLALLEKILKEGTLKGDRTGSGTLSIFGHQMRFNLADGFPLVTTKKIHIKSIIHELLWFLRGETNIAYLKQNNVSIWDEWADENGELGPIYGHQWRSWPTAHSEAIDQIKQVIHQLKNTPNSRRMIVTAWNVADLPDESLSPQQNVSNGKMALAPCHAFFQFYVAPSTSSGQAPSTNSGQAPSTGSGQVGKLSCQMYQRSCDTFLGVPFNIASYALLTHMVAQQTGLVVGDFIWTGGDVHLYLNHIEQAKLQLTRSPFPAPNLSFKRKPKSLFDYHYEDFIIADYQAHDPIKADISV